MRYNQNIQDYNTFIGQFPNSIWAGIGGFQRNNDYFQASAGAQNVLRSVLASLCVTANNPLKPKEGLNGISGTHAVPSAPECDEGNRWD